MVKRRTELARGAPLVTRKGLAPGKGLARTGRKPREAAVQRQEPRKRPGRSTDIPQASRDALAARSGNVCEGQLPGPCTQEATDWHHRQRRREHHDHRPANGLHLCRRCHDTVHNRPELSRAFGWICSAWSDPATEPVMLRGEQWVLLGDSYTPTEAPS